MISRLAPLALLCLALGCAPADVAPPTPAQAPAATPAQAAPPARIPADAPRFIEPKPGNLYASQTDTQLFVAWSLPLDLAPIRFALGSPAALDGVVGRTGVKLCAAKRAELGVADKPCNLQLLRLGSNDEYSKSAAGAWTTVGKFRLDAAASSAEQAAAVEGLDPAAVKALYGRFDLKAELLQ